MSGVVETGRAFPAEPPDLLNEVLDETWQGLPGVSPDNPFAHLAFSVRAFIARAVDYDWIAEGLFWRGALGMLFGESGSGKSFLTLDLLVALAAGAPAWGGGAFPLPRRRRVAYLAGEGGDGLRHRLTAALEVCAEAGLTVPEEALIVVNGVPNLFTAADALNVDACIAFGRELAANGGGPLDLLAIDTLSWATQGSDDNSNDDAMVIAANLQRLAGALGCAVLLVHQPNKLGGLRGASNYRNVLDFIWQLRNDGVLTCYKAKETELFAPLAFDLLPRPTFGGNSSCTVAWRETASLPETRTLRERLLAFQAACPSGARHTAAEIAAALNDDGGRRVPVDKVRMKLDDLTAAFGAELKYPDRPPSNTNPRVYFPAAGHHPPPATRW